MRQGIFTFLMRTRSGIVSSLIEPFLEEVNRFDYTIQLTPLSYELQGKECEVTGISTTFYLLIIYHLQAFYFE